MPTTTKTAIEVELENAPGTLGMATNALGDAGVNIQGFNLQAQGSTGTFSFVTDDPDQAESTLSGLGLDVETTDVVLVDAPNRPGELGRIGTKLGDSGVNIENGFPVFDPSTDHATLALEVDEIEAAAKVLG